MTAKFGSLAFTAAVQALQERYGSRRAYARQQSGGASSDRLGPEERAFIAQRDTFYIATTGSTGWPYVQHRGGLRGFLHVWDEQTLAFADVRGNKQYISTGNLATNDRAALIMVDYPNQARLKILAHVEVIEGDAAAAWLPRLQPLEPGVVVERVFVLRVEAFDWNCPQHIVPRYTIDEIRQELGALDDRLKQLERENSQLREQLAAHLGGP